MTLIPLTELPAVVQEMLKRLPAKEGAATLVALSGELGAGKTTFVQAAAKELGVQESVQSPTYVLMKTYSVSYKQFTELIHIDAYRLESADEFKTLMPEMFLTNSHNLVLIEWPSRVEGQLPVPDLTVKFSSETARAWERYIEII